jgi:hypothetical protein
MSEQSLTTKRLSSLDSVEAPQLQPVKETMVQYRKAGYQELLLEKLIKDVREGRDVSQ